jgi:hypothetical protein
VRKCATEPLAALFTTAFTFGLTAGRSVAEAGDVALVFAGHAFTPIYLVSRTKLTASRASLANELK